MKQLRTNPVLRNFWRHPDFPIYLLTIVMVIIGFVVVTHYGESWDEAPRYDYAERSLAAYIGGDTSDLADEKGAFFSMLSLLGSKFFDMTIEGWLSIDGMHFMNFLSFVMGVYFFYRLVRRYVDRWPAYLATLLYCTQPLLWGHSFINPKDTPFLAFFVATMDLGLEMVDRFKAKQAEAVAPKSWKEWLKPDFGNIMEDWRSAAQKSKRFWMTIGILLIALIIFFQPLRELAVWGVRQAASADSTSFIGSLFLHYAQKFGQVPVEAYAKKANTLAAWALLGVGVLLLFLWFVAARKVFPSVIDHVFLAGCFLGFCSAIRSLGPAAGVLVVIYFVVRAGYKAIPTLIKYLLSAAVTGIFFWPYLWSNPIANYLAALQEASDFPWWGNVMYAGKIYDKYTLPSSFIPNLIGLQFTEPALILAVIGLVIGVFYLIRRKPQWLDLLVLIVWLVAAPIAAIVLDSTLYNNFRQFLFVTPPLFILGSWALQEIWKLMKKNKVGFAVLGVIVLLPGLYWDIDLHPYEYIYYNSLVGNVHGAFRRYQLDYWCISYKAAMDYVNEVAPVNATIAVKGPYQSAQTYAREDLTVVQYNDRDNYPGDFPMYAVITSEFFADSQVYADSEVVKIIARDEVELTVVKKLETPTP